MKFITPLMEMTKKDLNSGELKMFGMSPDGHSAFVVSNQDVKTIYTKAQFFDPYAKLKVMPKLSFDETMDVVKEMQS